MSQPTAVYLVSFVFITLGLAVKAGFFKEPINDIWTEIASTSSRAISKIQGEVPTLTGLTNVPNSRAPSSP
jgi:hypothetical protein